MQLRKLHFLFLLLSLYFALPVRAQFLSVAAGGLWPQALSASTQAGNVARQARADFSSSLIVAVDGGIGFLPFIGASVHYSYSRPEVTLLRGDVLGSSARIGSDANTVTLDARVNTPRFLGIRAYGFAGAGVTRFGLNLKSQAAIPFPNGMPGNITAPVITYGGGVEKKLFPLLGAKLEVRDYLTPGISGSLFQPGGAWNRLLVVAGIVVGR